MHGQEQSKSSSILTRDCAFVQDSAAVPQNDKSSSTSFTNATLTTNHHQVLTNTQQQQQQTPSTIYHHHYSTTPPPPSQPSLSSLYERDQHHYRSTISSSTIPSLNTTMHHYNNTITTTTSSLHALNPPIPTQQSSPMNPTSRLEQSTTCNNNSASTVSSSNNTASRHYYNPSVVSTPQHYHQHSGSSSSSCNTPAMIDSTHYHSSTTNNYNNINNSSTPPKTSLSQFPYPHSSHHHHHQNAESTSGQVIRTHAPHSPIPQSHVGNVQPQAVVGIISRSSAYPPSTTTTTTNNTPQPQNGTNPPPPPHYHHHYHNDITPNSNSSSSITASLIHHQDLHHHHHYMVASHPPPQPAQPQSSSSSIAASNLMPRPVPSRQHAANADLQHVVESHHPSHSLLVPPPLNEKGSSRMNQNAKNQTSKQIDHKSCIICGKADTGNKYISYTINESNIEQYKGCFRHVEEIRIGDGVCKNCYAKKYKYVTGLSINKVKRKNTNSNASKPVSSSPSARLSQSQTITTSKNPINSSSSNGSGNIDGKVNVTTAGASQVHVSGEGGGSSSNNMHAVKSPQRISSPMVVSTTIMHDHSSQQQQQQYEDYNNSTSNSSRSSKYHDKEHVVVPTSSMHYAHYISTSSNACGIHHHHPNRSSPQSPPPLPTLQNNSTTTFRKTHHYHPYASNSEHHSQQYLNEPNSTSSNTSGRGNIPQSSPMHTTMHTLNYHEPFTTSPKSPRNNSASVPSIMEMMDTTPPSYTIESTISKHGGMSGVHVNNRTYSRSNSPLNVKKWNTKHVENALPRLETSLSTHRYHPYSSSNSSNNPGSAGPGHSYTFSSTPSSSREDLIHSPRIYHQEHLPPAENTPNPSPIRVASIVATGPAIPGNVHSHAPGTSQKHYSPPPISREEVMKNSNPIPSTDNLQPYVKKEVEDFKPNVIEVNANVSTNEKSDESTNGQLPEIKKEENNDNKENSSELIMVNVFLTFVTTSGTLSPTTRLSIPKSARLNQLKELIHKRLQKNNEEEKNILQIGDSITIGNIMLKKDENNFVEIDDQFCAIYRFEQHDSLKVSLIK